eukprot:jgi/Undpi1/597/HiC_scaffold_10.g04061.m1
MSSKMSDYSSPKQRRFAGSADEKQEDGEDGRSNLDHDGTSTFGSSAYESQADERWRTDTLSEDELDSGIKLSEKDEQRLLGAFLLAVEGGLNGGDSVGKGEEDNVVQLPSDGPTCLKKVVRSNGLVESTPGRPWQGAYDTSSPVVGFTYKVFRGYYLAKIQGELLEVNIRQAWDDLHYGTGKAGNVPSTLDTLHLTPRKLYHALPHHRAGGKRIPSRAHAAGLDTSTAAGAAATSGFRRNADYGSSGGEPYVTRAELQKILTREGEVLTDEEMDELLRECRPDDEGRIVYEGYRRMLIDPSL